MAVEELNPSFQRDIEAFRRYLEAYPSKRGGRRASSTIRVYLHVVRRLAEFLSEKGLTNFRDVDEEILEEFVLNLKSIKTSWKRGSKGTIKEEKPATWRWRNFVINVVCLFYRWLLGNDEEYPPCVKRIKRLVERRPIWEKSRIRSPDELLTREEILKMLEACDESRGLAAIRDKALIAVLYESGARIGEILALKRKDVKETNYGFRLLIKESKTPEGRRVIPIVDAAPYLAEWLNSHPYNDAQAPLFISMPRGVPTKKPLTRNGAAQLLDRIAKRAKINRHVYPHLLRHCRASVLCRQLSESYLKKLMGWSMSSNMPSIYIHLSGADVEEEVLRIHGLAPEREEEPLLERRVCQWCHEVNPGQSQYCSRCGRPLKTGVEVLRELDEAHRAIEEVEKLKEKLERLRGLEEEITRFREFVLGLLSGGRHPLEARDLLNFYEAAKKAKGRVVELKVEASIS